MINKNGDQPPMLKEYLAGKLKKEQFKLREMGLDDDEAPSIRDNYRKINRGERRPKSKRPSYNDASKKKRRRRKKVKKTKKNDSETNETKNGRRRKIETNSYDDEINMNDDYDINLLDEIVESNELKKSKNQGKF